jgi:hypothetical protein
MTEAHFYAVGVAIAAIVVAYAIACIAQSFRSSDRMRRERQ